MHKIFLVLYLTGVFSLSANAQGNLTDFFSGTDSFFKKYVAENSVNYAAVKQDPASLNALLTTIEQTKYKALDPAIRKAFLINTYNILVVKQIIDNYPLSSSQNVKGFYDKTTFNVGSEQLTLNHIENVILRPEYQDARLHFVLVCGAKGCPPIIPGAYFPSKLDEQLDEQTRRAMNDPYFTKVQSFRNTLELSEIFKWYKEDFTKNGQTEVDFINKYRKSAVPADLKIAYYSYDWSLNDTKSLGQASASSPASPAAKDSRFDSGKSNAQIYTPSVLLRQDQIEVKMFNNIYTQKNWFNPEGNHSRLNQRQTFYTGQIQLLYGVSASGRINAGFDVNIKGVRYDDDRNSSFLEVLSTERTPQSRMALSSFGPKVKIAPIESLDHFSIQSAFWIPVAHGTEQSPWLDYERYIWWNQFFYDHTFGDQFQVFTEADALFRFSKDHTRDHQITTPLSLFTSYFPTNKTTLYGMVQYAPTWTEEADNQDEIDDIRAQNMNLPGDQQLAVPNSTFGHHLNSNWNDGTYFVQAGVGGKYQITKSLEIELLYTNFFDGKNAGAGETFNVGFRYLR